MVVTPRDRPKSKKIYTPVKKKTGEKKPGEKKSRGAPKKQVITDPRVQKILSFLQAWSSVEFACHRAGLPTSTHYSRLANEMNILEQYWWLEYYIPYKDAVSFAKESTSVLAEGTIMKAMQNWDVHTARRWLERRKAEYRPKQESWLPSDFPSDKDFINDA